jgi:hypothetical protein
LPRSRVALIAGLLLVVMGASLVLMFAPKAAPKKEAQTAKPPVLAKVDAKS